METNNCINCNSELSGEFCSQCGQHVNVKRITFKSLMGEYLGRLFGMDTKLLRTAKDLTINPGIVARTYIDGNRVKYMGPIAFFFILTTLYLLSFSLLGVEIKDFLLSGGQQFNSAAQPDEITEKQLMFQQQIMGLISENMRIFGFLIIPFFGITGRFFYRRSGFNLLEHSVNGFYIFGQTSLLTIVMVFIYKITGLNLTLFISLITIPYYMWVTVKFYQKKGFWQWVKVLLVYIVSYIMFIMVFSILMGIGMIIYAKFFNPEFFK